MSDFIVCSRWGQARVRSHKERCSSCGAELAVSFAARRELPDVKPLCMDCARLRDPDVVPVVSPAVRAEIVDATGMDPELFPLPKLKDLWRRAR